MRFFSRAILVVLPISVSAPALAASPEGAWSAIEQAWRNHDAAGILAWAGSSIRLDINGQGPGSSSNDHAQAILANYFSGIETITFQFRDKTKGLVIGEHRYRRSGGGQEHVGSVQMVAEERGGRWILTEIDVYD